MQSYKFSLKNKKFNFLNEHKQFIQQQSLGTSFSIPVLCFVADSFQALKEIILFAQLFTGL